MATVPFIRARDLILSFQVCILCPSPRFTSVHCLPPKCLLVSASDIVYFLFSQRDRLYYHCISDILPLVWCPSRSSVLSSCHVFTAWVISHCVFTDRQHFLYSFICWQRLVLSSGHWIMLQWTWDAGTIGIYWFCFPFDVCPEGAYLTYGKFAFILWGSSICVFIMVIVSIFSVWQCTKVYQHFCLLGRYTNMWRDNVILCLWFVSSNDQWSLSHTHEPFVLFGKISYVGRLPISKLSYLLFCCWVLSLSTSVCLLLSTWPADSVSIPMACSWFRECLFSYELCLFWGWVSLCRPCWSWTYRDPPTSVGTMPCPNCEEPFLNLIKFQWTYVCLWFWCENFKKIRCENKNPRDLCSLLALCCSAHLTVAVFIHLELVVCWWISPSPLLRSWCFSCPTLL